MAIQYPDAPQFQVPNLNLLGSFAQGQSTAANALLAQERERKLADIVRTNAFLSQNPDLTKPGLAQAAIEQGIDPTNILGLQKGALEVESERAQLHGRQFDNLAKLRDRLQQDIMGVNSQADADALFARYGKIAPDLLPPNRMFTPENKRRWMMNTAQFLEASKPYERTYAGPDGQPVTGRFYLNPITQQEVPVGGAERKQAEEWTALKDSAGNITGYQSKYGTNVISPEEFQQRQYTDMREGRGKNPRSSAEGLGQFIDSTFVDTYRKVFPDKARGMSKEAILAQRGTTIDGKTPVEEPMLQAFTAANQQKLRDAGFQPSKGNTYLAHFLGADGALDVLGASPDTPVSELLSPKAIKANPEVFAKAKTAGDLIRWAGGGGAGESAARTFEPASMKPIGTVKRASQEASLNILNDLDIDPSGQDRVSKMIAASTSGPIETAGSQIPRAFGETTPGREAIAGLEVLAGEYTLEKIGGKLGAGISNEDRTFIVKTMGDIANPLIPAAERLRAWGEVKRRLAKYADVELPKIATGGRGKAGEMSAPAEKPAERKRIKFMELGD